MCLLRRLFSNSRPVSFYIVCVLQSFVAPVNMRAASRLKFSRKRLISMLQLSQIISPYSSKGRIKVNYNLLSERLSRLNICLRSAPSCLKALYCNILT